MKTLTVLVVGSLYRPEKVEDLPKKGIGGLGGSAGAEQASKTTPDAQTPMDAQGQSEQKDSPRAGQASKTTPDDQRLKQAQEDYDKKHKPPFDEACRALGAAFASRGWRVMVGATSWKQWTDRQTVAPFVIEGMNSVPPAASTDGHQLVFYAPRESEGADQGGTAETLQKISTDHKNLQVDYRMNAPGQYKAKIIPNVSEVDAVVLVHGKDGTAGIGYAAYCTNRPVIAVTGFGGAAREVYDDVLFNVYERFKESAQLTDQELLLLTAPWSASPNDDANKRNAEAVVSTAEKLGKGFSLAKRETTQVLKWAMGIMFLLLFAWVGVYLAGATVAELQAQATPATTETAKQPSELTQAAVPGASSGDTAKASSAEGESTLRRSGKAESQGAVTNDKDTTTAEPDRASPGTSSSDPNRNKKWWATPWGQKVIVSTAFFLLLYLSSAIGTGLRILVAFQRNQLAQLTGLAMFVEVLVALAVAFGLALFYMIGSISFTGQVTLLGSDAKNFATIAVSMSLLGLCAGYLLPIDKLHDRLQNIFTEEKKQ